MWHSFGVWCLLFVYHRNLIKIDKKWADELTRLARDADEEMRSLKDRHKEQRRNLAKVCGNITRESMRIVD